MGLFNKIYFCFRCPQCDKIVSDSVQCKFGATYQEDLCIGEKYPWKEGFNNRDLTDYGLTECPRCIKTEDHPKLGMKAILKSYLLVAKIEIKDDIIKSVKIDKEKSKEFHNENKQEKCRCNLCK